MELLRAGAVHELADRIAAAPRALRHVTCRLWDQDEETARRAAEALALALHRAPEGGREMVRRLLWALNDESGTNGGPALIALAAFARRAPEVLRPFAGALVPHLQDEGLAGRVLEVLEHLVEALPDVADDLRSDVRATVPLLRRDLAARLTAVFGLGVE